MEDICSAAGRAHDQDARSAQGAHPRLAGTSYPDARPPLRAETAATARNAAELRHQFHEWLALDTAADLVDDLGLVVYEAVANAVEHAYADCTDGSGTVRLEAHRTDGQVLIIVTDEGTWRAATGDSFRGRGLQLMRHLTDEVTIDSDRDGTVVRLRVALDTTTPLVGTE